MSATVSLTQTQIFTALASVLPQFGLTSSTPGQPIPVYRGQVNRVPEPAETDFIILWPIARNRLAMNVDTWTDNQVTGSICNSVLTVTDVLVGMPAPGQTLYGKGVTPGAQITKQLTGLPGAVGTYQTSPCADVASQTIYCGTQAALMDTEVVIQADIHGPAGADNAARIQTLWRDQFAVDVFNSTYLALAPLYTSDPRQLVFENAEQQFEERWSIDLVMQANVVITTTMQFADKLQGTATPIL